MRKVVLNLAISLDGFIEGPDGEFDWCFDDQDYGLTGFFESIDSIFIGRKSYELVKRMGDDMYKGIKMYVFSHTLQQLAEGEELISTDFDEAVNHIRQLPGKDIWLFGGASLASHFINRKLVDELMLSVHPIILGKGKPLFTDIHNRTSLKLKDTITYSSGLVQLIYTL